MVNLELSNEEREKLVHVLESYLSNLRMEIADTDSSFFKEDLKAEKELLNNILGKLGNDAE